MDTEVDLVREAFPGSSRHIREDAPGLRMPFAFENRGSAGAGRSGPAADLCRGAREMRDEPCEHSSLKCARAGPPNAEMDAGRNSGRHPPR